MAGVIAAMCAAPLIAQGVAAAQVAQVAHVAHARTTRDAVRVGLTAIVAIDRTHGDTIHAAIWYPTADAERDTTIALQPIHVAREGRYLAATAGQVGRALVVLSHGTGGDEFGHWDTAEALARAGFIVATIRHPGDNSRDHSGLGTDRYLYGRPTQMSALLDRVLADSEWGSRIDRRRIGALGYSAGGFTVLELVGGRPTVGLLATYCRARPRDPLYCADGLRGAFTMTGRYSQPPPDVRIRAAVLWAPAFSFLFDSAGVASVRAPMLVVRAERDSLVVEPENVAHLLRALPRKPELFVLPGAGHYTLLAPCGDALRRVVPAICADPGGVSRTDLHRTLNARVVQFFDRELAPRR